jgi:quinoprotein relay system zinc metallohydrolase 2
MIRSRRHPSPRDPSRRDALRAMLGLMGSWQLPAQRSAATPAPRPSSTPTDSTTQANATASTAPAGGGAAVHTALVTRVVAPGVHIRRGVDEDVSAANGNALANIGFVVGRDCVAVLDPGGALEDGRRLRARIREVTSLPIRFVLMSHVHPDHIFGAGAFTDDAPQFVGHARLPDAMALRGDYYRKGLDAVLGAGRAGPLVVPTRLVADRDRIDLGGRVLALTAHGVAHSDCDLSVFDPATGTLFPADLLFVGRVPSLDGSLKGWRQALAALTSIPAQRAVPGHGPVSVDWPRGAGDLDRYLRGLQRETRAAVKGGMDIAEAVAVVGRSERGRWKLFDDYQGHNVTQAFKEVEWE